MSQAVLTLNIGSSSVKASLRGAGPDDRTAIWTAHVAAIGEHAKIKRRGEAARPAPDLVDHDAAMAWAIREAQESAPDLTIAAVGHRIVHGGAKYAAPVAIDDRVFEELRGYISLAPNHQPHNLKGVEAARKALPDALQVACFDTAFHRTMPQLERLFALPRHFAREGVLRYGFHGLSYAYIASILPDHLGHAADGRVIVAHLGSGASLCAMLERRSRATTMGFTALDGPPMSTRCGSIDPGVLLHLITEGKMNAEELSDLLYNRSGLLGVSGISGDMQTLLASGDPRAEEAVELFVHHVAREIGSLAAAVEGLDAIVFTAGIGENSAPIRARIAKHISWLGAELDESANAKGVGRINAPSSRISLHVIPTDEEGEIARETKRVLAASR